MFKGIVVGKMAKALHLHELIREVLNLLWKPLQNALGTSVSALPLDLSMVQRSIYLSPGLPGFSCHLAANKQVRAAIGQGMKKRIVGGADGSSQFGLPRSPAVGSNPPGSQTVRYCEKIVWIHESFFAKAGHSDFLTNN